MIDVNKPMRIYFTSRNYPVANHAVVGDSIFVRPGYATGHETTYYRFNLDGSSAYPKHRLVNEPEPKRKFTKVIAWVEHYGNVSPILITERIEDCGIERYLRSYVPGKCIAITEVSFEEGEGHPPVY
jgi:hypothetical protein